LFAKSSGGENYFNLADARPGPRARESKCWRRREVWLGA